ncbi:hypothetical protein ACLB1E_32220 [Escherichia coli]
MEQTGSEEKPLRWNNWSVEYRYVILPYPPGVPLLMPGEMLTKQSLTTHFLLMLCTVGQHYPGFETDIHGAKQDEDGVYRVRVLKMAG